jgi:hypothetical protein
MTYSNLIYWNNSVKKYGLFEDEYILFEKKTYFIYIRFSSIFWKAFADYTVELGLFQNEKYTSARLLFKNVW